MPEETLESLQERIQSLLSFEPTLKPDKFAENVITRPMGAIAKQIKHGYVSATFKGMFGNKVVPGVWGYQSYLDLNENGPSNSELHLYSVESLEQIPNGLQDVSIVLHSHDRDQYCPYKAGCHTFMGSAYPVRYRMAEIPKWFKDIWNHIYNFKEEDDEVPSNSTSPVVFDFMPKQ